MTPIPIHRSFSSTRGTLGADRRADAKLETPDEHDWVGVTNALVPIARGMDLLGASQLRDRLVVLASEYAPKAATVNRSLLSHAAHDALESDVLRDRQGWQSLTHLHDQALASIRDEVVAADGTRLRLDRSTSAVTLLADADKNAVVAHGDSGVGKSALVIQAATEASGGDQDGTQVLCVNLRHLPALTLELQSFLGAPLAELLAELGARRRLLVIDGSDAISEDRMEAFRYLLDAARRAEVTVIAITANDTRQLVHDTVAERLGAHVVDYLVPLLTDEEVDHVIATFHQLEPLAIRSQSHELLRRLVVVDLLVRGRLTSTPLSDADAMNQVSEGLVRRQGRSDHGTPHARQNALLRLADLALHRGDSLDAVERIDPAALSGLLQDGLLRSPTDDPFKIGPGFAHDEIRRYAVARLLLAQSDLTSKLVDVGVPRWTLGAARLACQALLSQPDTPSSGAHGRFARLQKIFDELVEAGHGDRWGDVPGEALLTLGDPDPVLRDVWPELSTEHGSGLRRLTRLVDQRLHDDKGLVRIGAVEPVVNLLLDNDTPWRLGEHVHHVLRDWLRALVLTNTPVGHPLRIRLRERLINMCIEVDQQQTREQQAAAAARAARSEEENEEETKRIKQQNGLFTAIGHDRPRRIRPGVPREITDELVVELLALLGLDLGDQGEATLRRIAQYAPAWLGPAVDDPFTSRALAMCRQGLLAELTEAYYLDDEEDGFGFHDDGIRHHDAHGLGVFPLSAWYKGPFMPLFQSDFRNGVAVLNRMLNHAALVRIRGLVGHQYIGVPMDEKALDVYRAQLDITGTTRTYVGDGQVWRWYRGTGVGPPPCASALQALERLCDQFIEVGIPLSTLVPILLEECESLAMVGLVVGLLVRHFEKADDLLDPFLAEPVVWNQEFSRLVAERTGLGTSSDDLVYPERRGWSLREVAMMMVMRSNDARADEIRAVGQRLIATAQRLVDQRIDDIDSVAAERFIAGVRAWASCLDRSTYEAHATDEGVLIQSTPPDEIVDALHGDSVEFDRTQEAMRLLVRYFINPKQGKVEPITPEELYADLAVAAELLDDPPAASPVDQWDASAQVALVALQTNVVDGVDLPDDALLFAVDVVLCVAERSASPRPYEFEESYFEQGADRRAALAIPLLLSPQAARLRGLIDDQDGTQTYQRAVAAGFTLARVVANEVRVHLARGLDRLWEAPSASTGTCHHETAMQLTVETMRDCAFGDWNGSRKEILELSDPVGESLSRAADDNINFSRLDAAMRALAPAAAGNICLSAPARDLLLVLLEAHRRSLLAYDQEMDRRGTHALVAARAILTLIGDGDESPLYQHLDAFADNATLMNTFLRALSAAAEESPDRASTAKRVWPALVSHIIGLEQSGHTPFRSRYHDDYARAALMPNPAAEVAYLYREVETEPIIWWDPLSWELTVEEWLATAQGSSTCIDQLISFMAGLPIQDQARVGLPWVAKLVLCDPGRVANRSFLIASWLIENREAASDADLLPVWQRVVDALVVAGQSRLAPYSE